VLVPKIWKLTNYKTNEIFYQSGDDNDIDKGQTIVTIISQVLDKAGIANSDYDIGGLSNKLLKREYVCQYNESDFDFISRLLENEGVFYYFEQSFEGEKIIFVNDTNYLSIPRPKLLFDVAAMTKSQDDCVFNWSCKIQRSASKVVVRDYNAEEPSLDVSDTSEIDINGQGTEYIYGKNVKTDVEASYLSNIRAEQHICRKMQFFGNSSVTRLQAGYDFKLDRHPNEKYNHEYLILEVHHEGHSLDMSISTNSEKDAKPQYQNSFVAIKAETQYRPALKTNKPRITGTLHARIDGELNSEYAQLDSEGRYKVSMPFDFHNEDHPEGLASARVRMMQPYAGKNRGMQFPMAKGTEVLLSFVDGDPDRPIIAGAINTAAAPGPVTADNQTESVIQTGGNNKIRFEDEEGRERVILESPKENSYIRLGTPNDPLGSNDPGPAKPEHKKAGIRISSDGALWSSAVNRFAEYIGGASYALGKAFGQKFNPDEAKLTKQLIEKEYRFSKRTVTEMMFEYSNFRPTNLKRHDNGDPEHSESDEQFEVAFSKGHVTANTLDVFMLNEGNVYDFKGYHSYNLGDGYTEDHWDQSAELNSSSLVHDMLADSEGNQVGGPKWNKIKWPEKAEKTFDVGTGAAVGAAVGALLGGQAALGAGVGAAIVGLGNASDSALGESDTKLAGDYWDNNIFDPYYSQDGAVKKKLKENYDDDRFYFESVGRIEKEEEKEGKVWVTKRIGHDYEYHKGDAISVNVGDTLDVQHGGRHIEIGYREPTDAGKSTMASWSHSEAGVTREKKWTSEGVLIYESETKSTASAINEEEKKYDRNTGALYSHTRSDGTGMGLAKFEFDYSNTVAMAINSGSLISSETFMGAKIMNENYMGVKIVNENLLGASLKVELALGGVIEIKNTKFEANFPGMKAKGCVAELDTKMSAIDAIATTIKSGGVDLEAKLTAIEGITVIKVIA